MMPHQSPYSSPVASPPSTYEPEGDVVTDHDSTSTLVPDPTCEGIFAEIREERIRAHAKHGATSMESLDIDDLTRLTVLMEEVGEVASEFNEARHYGFLDTPCLRTELIQVAAMAAAWADALTHPASEWADKHVHAAGGRS